MREIIYIISAIITIFAFVTGIQKVPDFVKTFQPPKQENGTATQNGNPYGTGNGKLTIYKTCNNCPDLTVAIDGYNAGTLSTPFTEGSLPSCDATNGTISKVLSTGNHILTAKDGTGTTWNTTFSILEGQCSMQKLTKPDDSPSSPFGIGNGKVTLYTTCANCPNLEVSIDGRYTGNLSQIFSPSVEVACGANGTISQVLSFGNHQITAKDSYGTNWNFQIYITEGQCSLQKLEKPNDAPPPAAGANSVATNPYGNGNGQITIYENCSNCPNVQVYIDGVYAGVLTAFFQTYQTPTCGVITAGSIVKTASSGYHKITATDSNGDSWNGDVYVDAGVCKNYPLQGFLQHTVTAAAPGYSLVGPNTRVYVNPGGYAPINPPHPRGPVFRPGPPATRRQHR